MQTQMDVDDLQIDNLPNRLTLLRVILIPFVITLLYLTESELDMAKDYKVLFGWIAAWIFGIASITDFFDGYIARKRNIVTVFGSFLDPIADKFLTVSSLIMLQSLGRVPSAVVIILVLREMYMTSLRLLARNEELTIPVSDMGKWKTAIQMFGIPLLMANEVWMDLPLPLIGSTCIYIACILSIWSATTYTFGMVNKLKKKRAHKRKLKKLAKRQKGKNYNE